MVFSSWLFGIYRSERRLNPTHTHTHVHYFEKKVKFDGNRKVKSGLMVSSLLTIFTRFKVNSLQTFCGYFVARNQFLQLFLLFTFSKISSHSLRREEGIRRQLLLFQLEIWQPIWRGDSQFFSIRLYYADLQRSQTMKSDWIDIGKRNIWFNQTGSNWIATISSVLHNTLWTYNSIRHS